MIVFFPRHQTSSTATSQKIPSGAIVQEKLAAILFLLLLALQLTACSGTSAPPQPEWTLAEKAVRLTFKADAQVNFYDEQPHTVAVAVYQLAEPGGFSQLLTYPTGLQQVLTGGKELPPSLASDQFFLQPGESVEKVYDRAEGAKWLVIAAGLYTASPKESGLLEKIPVKIERSWLTFSKSAVIPIYTRTVLLTKSELKLETSPE